jgi:hypothetical protein
MNVREAIKLKKRNVGSSDRKATVGLETLQALRLIRGLWQSKNLDPVKYQKALREESERHRTEQYARH